MMKDLALFTAQESDSPVAVASENAVLDAYQHDDEVWVVFPGEEHHWSPDDWTEEGIDRSEVPWWLLTLWVVFFLWAAMFIVYGSTQW